MTARTTCEIRQTTGFVPPRYYCSGFSRISGLSTRLHNYMGGGRGEGADKKGGGGGGGLAEKEGTHGKGRKPSASLVLNIVRISRRKFSRVFLWHKLAYP